MYILSLLYIKHDLLKSLNDTKDPVYLYVGWMEIIVLLSVNSYQKFVTCLPWSCIDLSSC